MLREETLSALVGGEVHLLEQSWKQPLLDRAVPLGLSSALPSWTNHIYKPIHLGINLLNTSS